MKVHSLHLQNFRCYLDAALDLPSQGALITGPNGSGKTNLLESILYLSCGKSQIAGSEREMIRFDNDFLFAKAACSIAEKEHSISIGLDRNNQKKAIVDGTQLEKISDLYRYLKAIYFSPTDVNMVSGSGGIRRLVFNQAISQYSFGYLENYRNYQRILKQRNALLKTDHYLIEKKSWDNQFAQAAAKLVRLRLEYLEAFLPRFQDAYRTISGNAEEAGLRYHSSFDMDDELPILEAYQQRIEAIATRETESRYSLIGPHLDDFIFDLNRHPARAYASQGQRRSISIAVRLAQAELIKEASGDTPIMMFDDVLAELDANRAHHLIEMLNPEHQIFIATPNPGEYRHFDFRQIDVTTLPRAIEIVS